jgi:hypothetical protein
MLPCGTGPSGGYGRGCDGEEQQGAGADGQAVNAGDVHGDLLVIVA